ncbi:hypothetical protein WT24_19155 [Burkholderia sp. MSMB1078WGS]|nr:hypothetical protein WT24_19155 [Burkholderia sp. MSMB1078WGS]
MREAQAEGLTGRCSRERHERDPVREQLARMAGQQRAADAARYAVGRREDVAHRVTTLGVTWPTRARGRPSPLAWYVPFAGSFGFLFSMFMHDGARCVVAQPAASGRAAVRQVAAARPGRRAIGAGRMRGIARTDA